MNTRFVVIAAISLLLFASLCISPSVFVVRSSAVSSTSSPSCPYSSSLGGYTCGAALIVCAGYSSCLQGGTSNTIFASISDSYDGIGEIATSGGIINAIASEVALYATASETDQLTVVDLGSGVQTVSFFDTATVSGTCKISGNPDPTNLAPCLKFVWSTAGELGASGSSLATGDASLIYYFVMEDYAVGVTSLVYSSWKDSICMPTGSYCKQVSTLNLANSSVEQFPVKVSSGDVITWSIEPQVYASTTCDPCTGTGADRASASAYLDPGLVIDNLDPTDLGLNIAPVGAIANSPSTLVVSNSLSPNPVSIGAGVTDSALLDNTGTSALSGLSVLDSMGATLSCPSSTLASGSSETCTGSFTAPITVGSLTDYVVGTGTDGLGNTISGGSSNTLTVSSLVTPEFPLGSITGIAVLLTAFASFGLVSRRKKAGTAKPQE